MNIIKHMNIKKQIPAYANLIREYQNDPDCKYLRFGQWFYNNFLGDTFGEVRDLVDKLHSEPNYKKCQDMILKLYVDYQWPMI